MIPKLFLIAATCFNLGLAYSSPTPLFNGKDLAGWKVALGKEGVVSSQEIFKVANGLIHVYPTQVDQSEQPYAGLVTENEYSHYNLSLEYKWGEKKFVPRESFVRDAGILLHLHGSLEMWPNSVECQIQEGDTGDMWIIGSQASSTVQNVIRNYSPNGKSVTRGGLTPRFARFHRAYSWETPGWNTVELVVRGDRAKFFVNGQLVNEATDMKQWDAENEQWIPLEKGPILLQAEGAELYYRNIAIEEFEPELDE